MLNGIQQPLSGGRHRSKVLSEHFFLCTQEKPTAKETLCNHLLKDGSEEGIHSVCPLSPYLPALLQSTIKGTFIANHYNKKVKVKWEQKPQRGSGSASKPRMLLPFSGSSSKNDDCEKEELQETIPQLPWLLSGASQGATNTGWESLPYSILKVAIMVKGCVPQGTR